MPDGGGDEELVIVDFEGWQEYCPYFSDGAVVVVMYLSLDVVPLDVELPVSQFVWPQPPTLVSVGVHEPDMDGFMRRLKKAGVDVPGDDVVYDMDEALLTQGPTAEVEIPSPGASFDTRCSSCGEPVVYAVSVALLYRLGSSYAESVGGRLELRRCLHEPSHGAHAYIRGRRLFAVQCAVCMDTFLLGPAVPGGFVRHLVEVG